MLFLVYLRYHNQYQFFSSRLSTCRIRGKSVHSQLLLTNVSGVSLRQHGLSIRLLLVWVVGQLESIQGEMFFRREESCDKHIEVLVAPTQQPSNQTACCAPKQLLLNTCFMSDEKFCQTGGCNGLKVHLVDEKAEDQERCWQQKNARRRKKTFHWSWQSHERQA